MQITRNGQLFVFWPWCLYWMFNLLLTCPAGDFFRMWHETEVLWIMAYGEHSCVTDSLNAQRYHKGLFVHWKCLAKKAVSWSFVVIANWTEDMFTLLWVFISHLHQNYTRQYSELLIKCLKTGHWIELSSMSRF